MIEAISEIKDSMSSVKYVTELMECRQFRREDAERYIDENWHQIDIRHTIELLLGVLYNLTTWIVDDEDQGDYNVVYYRLEDSYNSYLDLIGPDGENEHRTRCEVKKRGGSRCNCPYWIEIFPKKTCKLIIRFIYYYR